MSHESSHNNYIRGECRKVTLKLIGGLDQVLGAGAGSRRGGAAGLCLSNHSAFLHRRRFPSLLACFPSPHLGHPFSRIHGAAALSRAAVAGRRILVVVEVVVPDEFFSCGDVADREEPDAALDLIHLAIGIARVVQIRAQAVSVNYRLAIVEPVEVGAGDAIVTAIGFVNGDALPRVLNDASAFTNRGGGVDADGMNGRRAND